jgi:hypothetical protein
MTNRAYTKKITVANETAVDTLFDLDGDVSNARKYFVTSFQGSGNLEASDDKTNWIDTGKTENTAIGLSDSLPRYVRINGSAGDKVIHLLAI